MADWRALISGSTGRRSKERSSSVRFPGTNVYTFFSPLSGQRESRV
jgi:hypothetical protein